MATPTRPQLAKLAQRIPTTGGPQGTGFIEKVKAPGGPQDYVAHHVINQFLLLILGPFSFELVQVHRGDVLARVQRDGTAPFTGDSATLLTGVVVGATYRLRVTVDGQPVIIEATGDVDQPTNWPHDGARLKDAESDALKRAAMRLGLGLELWAKEHYVLDRWLPIPPKDEPAITSGARAAAGPAPDPTFSPAGPNPGKAGTAGEDTTQQHTSRSHTITDTSAEPAAPPAAAPPAEDAPAATAPAPPGVAAGATTNGHPADQATTMEELAAALGCSLNNCWLRLRRAGQDDETFAAFTSLTDAKALKALQGEDFELARAWLIDHNQGAAT